MNNLTRKLCAAVHLNASLRDKIIAFGLDPFRLIVNSPDIALKPVLTHALRARRRERNRNYFLFLPALMLVAALIIIVYGDEDGLDALPGVLATAFGIMLLVMIVFTIEDYLFVKTKLRPSVFQPDLYEPDLVDKVATAEAKVCKNVVYYSGYSPFVGYGIDIGGWSFVLDIDRAPETPGASEQPKDFTEMELYEAIDAQFTSLKLPNLVLDEKVFYQGNRIRVNFDVLPDFLSHPVPEVSNDIVHQARSNALPGARYYKIIQIRDSNGEVIVTTFIRIQKDEKTLFVEGNYFLLPPVVRWIDNIDHQLFRASVTEHLALAPIVGIFSTITSLVRTPGLIITELLEPFGFNEYRERKVVKRTPDYDYGSETSLREAISEPSYSKHFHKLDKERLMKTVEKRFFNSLSDFFESKNIDTSEFLQREAKILNNGVIVTGGNLQTENLSVGKRSSISVSQKS